MTHLHISDYQYPGFHDAPSSCDLKIWKELNIIIASHQDFKGTSPTNAIERIAKKAAKEFKLNLKKLRVIIQVPKDHSPTYREYFSLVNLKMIRNWCRLSVVDAEFDHLEYTDVLKLTSKQSNLKPKHKILFQWLRLKSRHLSNPRRKTCASWS